MVWWIYRLIHAHAGLATLRHIDTDQARLLRCERIPEDGLELFGAVHFLRSPAIARRDLHQVDARQVHTRRIAAHLREVKKRFQCGVVRIA